MVDQVALGKVAVQELRFSSFIITRIIAQCSTHLHINIDVEYIYGFV